jgi:hypothetical protein
MTLIIPHLFYPGTKAKAGEVNANFTACKNAINSNEAAIAQNMLNILTKASKNGNKDEVFAVATPTSSIHATPKEFVENFVESAVSKINLSNYIDGLVLSNNATDSNKDIDIAAGVAMDSTNTVEIILASALTKQLDSNWIEGSGAGGRASGVDLTSDTWYHVFVIAKEDGTVDAGFDNNINATNLLADAAQYSYFRRIGSIKTNSNINILGFFQIDDTFYWKDKIVGYAQQNPGFNAITLTLNVPSGVNVLAEVNAYHSQLNYGGFTYLNVTSLDQSDVSPLTNFDGIAQSPTVSVTKTVKTNISSQIRLRCYNGTGASDSNTYMWATCDKWIDKRGKQ